MVRSYVAGKTFNQFGADTQLQDAVIRRLAIIGEAVERISDGTRGKLPLLPWDDMARMRNILVHAYFSIDLKIVWNTVTTDLQPLINAVNELLATRSGEARA